MLGPNGAGKSTLLRIMAGVEETSSGSAELAAGATVGFLPQEPDLDPAKDVRGNVEDGVRPLRDRFNAISAQFAEPDADYDSLLAEQAKVQEEIDRRDAWTLDAQLDRAMDALRVPEGDRDVTTLSGGERRRVALCRLLLSSPDLLLLDEPTNHLDAESVAWLERFLAEYAGTVVAVTHDRYFLDNVAGWILELDRGRDPVPGQLLRLARAEAGAARDRGEAGVGPPACAQDGARVGALLAGRAAREVEGAARRLRAAARGGAERQARPGRDPHPGRAAARRRRGRGRGRVEGFGDRLLVEDMTFSLPPGGIVGVIGPNGAGKTTLFRMIAGEEQPDSGELRVGETVEPAYVDQSRAGLEAGKTVWQEISGGHDTLALGSREVNSRQYVSWFNFKGSDQQKRVGDLSGGERNRVHLAKLLRSGGNLLLLDEPTNDLDVDTLRALEDALLDFAGCAAVISHDRWFLDRVATHILAFEGDSQVTWFEGSFEEYEQWVRETRGGARAAPDQLQAARSTGRLVRLGAWPKARQAQEARQEGRAEVAEGEAERQAGEEEARRSGNRLVGVGALAVREPALQADEARLVVRDDHALRHAAGRADRRALVRVVVSALVARHEPKGLGPLGHLVDLRATRPWASRCTVCAASSFGASTRQKIFPAFVHPVSLVVHPRGGPGLTSFMCASATSFADTPPSIV